MKLWGHSDGDWQDEDREAPRAERRAHPREDFAGSEAFLFLDDRLRHSLRLKTLCAAGASGLTDAPLKPGQWVTVQFDETSLIAAQVCWTRLALVGLHFPRPIPASRFSWMRERHASGAAWTPAMRLAPREDESRSRARAGA